MLRLVDVGDDVAAWYWRRTGCSGRIVLTAMASTIVVAIEAWDGS